MKKLLVKYTMVALVGSPILANTVWAKSTVQGLAGVDDAMARNAQTLETLRDAERLREIAMARGDVELLKSLLSEYYYHVESNGRIRSKAQFLASLQRGEFKFLSYRIDEIEVRINGPVGVAHGRFTVTREFGPDKKPYSGRFIRIWEYDGERWRNTMHQATEVKPAITGAVASLPTS